MGFEKGLKEWRSLLKPRGYLAVSEVTWLRPDPPREVYDYWLEQYPAMKNIDDNLAIIRKSGYRPIGHFTLPYQDWWTDYYDHIETRLAGFGEKYRHDPEALQVVDMEAVELEMHRRYSDYYGYVFYTMQK